MLQLRVLHIIYFEIALVNYWSANLRAGSPAWAAELALAICLGKSFHHWSNLDVFVEGC